MSSLLLLKLKISETKKSSSSKEHLSIFSTLNLELAMFLSACQVQHSDPLVPTLKYLMHQYT